MTASLFYAKFDDYIYAQATGAEKGKLDVYAYTAVDATFYGYELEAERILYAGSDALLTAGLISDYVLAENDTANTDLPRIPPFRIGGEIAIDYKEGTLLCAFGKVSISRNMVQTRPKQTALLN